MTNEDYEKELMRGVTRRWGFATLCTRRRYGLGIEVDPFAPSFAIRFLCWYVSFGRRYTFPEPVAYTHAPPRHPEVEV